MEVASMFEEHVYILRIDIPADGNHQRSIAFLIALIDIGMMPKQPSDLNTIPIVYGFM